MVDMFEWFNKYMKENENKKKENKIEDNFFNCRKNENGDVIIKTNDGRFFKTLTIPKSSIISYGKNTIKFEDQAYTYNYGDGDGIYFLYMHKPIENKKSLIRCKETQIKTYRYHSSEGYWGDYKWRLIRTETINKEVVSERIPLDIFKEHFNSKYKLIETEEEFNEYVSSTLDCDTWCRKKLYNKMKELGLGDGFINQFADLVGNDLDKYHAMIDLANEVTDKDTLMYLYTYKFREE